MIEKYQIKWIKDDNPEQTEIRDSKIETIIN